MRQADRGLIPVADYACPALPADEWFRVLWRRVLTWLRPTRTSVIPDDQLRRATLRRLDQVVAPPACGPVLAELQASVAEWLAQSPTAERIRAIVLPPCQDGDVLGVWADSNGHQILRVDHPRDVPDALVRLERLPDDPNALLVVPRLEFWHVRRVDGLAGIRALIAALTRRRQRAVISCNAWTWAYLSKAAGIDMIAARPLCFAPMDGDRLRDWFRELARDDDTRGFRFRLSDDGTDLFGDEVTDVETDLFRTLAARSLGVPWVAWHMWRRMLHRSDGDPSVPEAGNTLWVTAPEELTLPAERRPEALLILHALILHGRMSIEDLASVLPLVGETVAPAGLMMAGVIAQEGDALFVRAEAYPVVRAELQAAGMSVGGI